MVKEVFVISSLTTVGVLYLHLFITQLNDSDGEHVSFIEFIINNLGQVLEFSPDMELSLPCIKLMVLNDDIDHKE